jgi:hypothetical protein
MYDGLFYFFERDAAPQSLVISEATQESFVNLLSRIPSQRYCFAEADTVSHGGVSSAPLCLGQQDKKHSQRSDSPVMNIGNPWSFSFCPSANESARRRRCAARTFR